MSNLQELHNKALEIAKIAFAHLEKGDKNLFIEKSKEAYLLEKEAAEMLFQKRDAEPTRSILYRSAATIAFNVGMYEEAKKLIHCALSGSPYIEIKDELDDLLGLCNEKIALMYTEVDAIDLTYLEVLREKAFNIKLEPKSDRRSKAIFTEHIIELLRAFNSSYISYAKANLRKLFNPIEQEEDSFNKKQNDFLKESKVLCVDLAYKSFGVSIVVDNVTMFDDIEYSAEFKKWKSKLFDEFKKEVVLPNYNSDGFIENVVGKYSEEERRAIFSPIIDITRDNSPFKFHLVENKFSKIIKTYVPTTVSNKNILVPKLTLHNEIEPKVLKRKFDLVSATGKGPRKNILEEELNYAEFKKYFNSFSVGDKSIDLYSEYEIMVVFENGSFKINDEHLNINLFNNDFEKILKQYNEKIIELYSEIILIQSPNAVEQESILKFESIVFSRNW